MRVVDELSRLHAWALHGNPGQRETIDAAYEVIIAVLSDSDETVSTATWFEAADRLTAIIESRMSCDLAWLSDDGKTVIRLNPEEIAYHITHLYRTGDVVSGLPPLTDEEPATPPSKKVAP